MELSKKPYHKKTIPKAMRIAVWEKNCGEVYKYKCYTTWCTKVLTVHEFECGHDTPESHGGKTEIDNLYPICSTCNKSMSNNYNFEQWNKLGSHPEVKEGNLQHDQKLIDENNESEQMSKKFDDLNKKHDEELEQTIKKLDEIIIKLDHINVSKSCCVIC